MNIGFTIISGSTLLPNNISLVSYTNPLEAPQLVQEIAQMQEALDTEVVEIDEKSESNEKEKPKTVRNH